MDKNTANANLDIVQEMISLARNRVIETGFHFLLWGVLVTVASLAQYIMIKLDMGAISNFVWLGIVVIGVPAAIMYEKRRDRQVGASSHFDRIYAMVWLGFGIALFLSIYVSIANEVNPTPFILLLVGLATFISGAILRFSPLIIGAVVFWIASGVSPLFSGVDFLLVYAAVIFLGYVIPGLMLAKKSQANV